MKSKDMMLDVSSAAAIGEAHDQDVLRALHPDVDPDRRRPAGERDLTLQRCLL